MKNILVLLQGLTIGSPVAVFLTRSLALSERAIMISDRHRRCLCHKMSDRTNPETVRNRGLVSLEDQPEVYGGLSNGPITDPLRL